MSNASMLERPNALREALFRNCLRVKRARVEFGASCSIIRKVNASRSPFVSRAGLRRAAAFPTT
jgi:hypothetical protein